MSLVDNFPTNYPTAFYDEKFRAILEDHIAFLKSNVNTKTVRVVGVDAIKYRGDLNGYLTLIKVPHHHHWITMRLNDFTNPNQFDETIQILYIPDQSLLEKIRQQYTTVVV